MTTQELNRDFKRLFKQYKANRGQDTTNWSHDDWIKDGARESALKAELLRLYYASYKFQYANRNSILYFIEINQSIRAVPWHTVRTYLTSI